MNKLPKVGSSHRKSEEKVGFVMLVVLGAPIIIASFNGSKCISDSVSNSSGNIFVMLVVLGAPIIIASFFPSAFSKALDFAGVYANCFLFGVLPPMMAWIHRSRKKFRSSTTNDVNLLPGGNTILLLLFVIAVILGIWH